MTDFRGVQVALMAILGVSCLALLLQLTYSVAPGTFIEGVHSRPVGDRHLSVIRLTAAPGKGTTLLLALVARRIALRLVDQTYLLLR